jgi:hypothetical protein
MSAIIHRCDCGCPDLFHTDRSGRRDSMGRCNNGCQACPQSYGEPELIPTWSAPGATEAAVLDADVLKPGSRTALGELCDCDACRQLYTGL